MTLKNKVVWAEGMFLRPQHFQQFERYFEQFVHLRGMMQQKFFRGFLSYQLDKEALGLGRVALQSAQGVMPDGTPFSFATTDEAPQPLEIPPAAKSVMVYLTLPMQREGANSVAFDDMPSSARYQAYEEDVPDTNEVSQGPALLQVGRLRLRLMMERDLAGEWLAIGVARITERTSDNSLKLDEQYIPPMLSVDGNVVLSDYVKELHSLLEQRSEVLSQGLAQPGRGGTSELNNFLLLELINRYLAITWHVQHEMQIHPERLFQEWLKLACDLMTYTSPTRRPSELPVYDHDNLQVCYGKLMAELRRSLSVVLDRNAFQIILHHKEQGVHVGRIPSIDILRTYGFIMAVGAEMPAEQIRTLFPTQVKIGPVERIKDLVQLNLPGVVAQSMAVAPRQIPYNSGYCYFQLDKGGEMWKQLERSGVLALHLAGEFPGLTMELWAIKG